MSEEKKVVESIMTPSDDMVSLMVWTKNLHKSFPEYTSDSIPGQVWTITDYGKDMKFGRWVLSVAIEGVATHQFRRERATLAQAKQAIGETTRAIQQYLDNPEKIRATGNALKLKKMVADFFFKDKGLDKSAVRFILNENLIDVYINGTAIPSTDTTLQTAISIYYNQMAPYMDCQIEFHHCLPTHKYLVGWQG